MHVNRFMPLLAVVLGVCLPLAASAEEGGWKMPNLNPFAKKSGPPTSSSAGSGWKMPTLPGQAQAASTWKKMTGATKSMFSKTADVLNPFDDAGDNQQAQPEAQLTGRNSAFRQATMSSGQSGQNAKSKSFLPSWNWGGEEKEKKPQTVQDFLAQPRPGY